ncbi:protein kinase-like domain-containing protein [Xylariomycetidae sp. FL2044]|nr:protein kinase-like domain-containing protein [Xylariomycetidae sp. FL2044]
MTTSPSNSSAPATPILAIVPMDIHAEPPPSDDIETQLNSEDSIGHIHSSPPDSLFGCSDDDTAELPKQVYHLEWNTDSFSPTPRWTNEPTIESIIATLKLRIDTDRTYSVKFAHDGICSKVYDVEYDGTRCLMSLSLPVQPGLKTRSEVATLYWIHENTRLPVPEVIAFDTTQSNPIGLEWILTTRMDGEPLSRCWKSVSWSRKERIVEQLLEYASIIYEEPFHGGIGNLQPPNTEPNGQTADESHPRGPFRDISQWTDSRLRLTENYLTSMISRQEDNEKRGIGQRMLGLVQRLGRLRHQFLPSAAPIDAGVEPLDAPAATMLWHDNMSLDNILVSENGVFTGLIGWECIPCLPLQQACRLPKFLEQPRDRLMEPMQLHYYDLESGILSEKYYDDMKQFEITNLRHVFLEAMQCLPRWAEAFQEGADWRDFDAALRHCNNEATYEIVESWVSAVESGASPGRLHEELD